jgi:hypothetical protein
MSCFAVFSLKWPSLLAYDEGKRDPHIAHNLQNLYRIQNAPSDTLMRERLDELDPSLLKPSFKKVFAIAQRGKDLEPYQYLNKKYLVSNDATGHFSSSKIHCKNCCTKKHKDGSCTYHHQMLSAVIVHPDHKAVIPLGVEEIHKQDGDAKNDCERNAVRRLLETLRRHHPHLDFNTLKNQGYNFEHNYGHGKDHLCSVMGILMMIAFLIDQVQLLGCRLYRKAKQKARTFSALWYEMRTLFKYFFISSWEFFLQAIAETEVAHLNTS